MIDSRESDIVEFIKMNHEVSSRDISDGISVQVSYATVKRILTRLLDEKLLIKSGKGKATKYSLSPSYELLYPIDIEKYYEKEIDERTIRRGFNFKLIRETLGLSDLFTGAELELLRSAQKRYEKNISQLSTVEYNKEMERLAIDLSWKSSQIEGNTYSLLETERLLREQETASGKSKEEATMLLNHKEAIDFIVENPDFIAPLSVKKIEEIHSILIRELGVEKSIRRRGVGITGTNYRPLDNEFQILEALEDMCELVNGKDNVFEKALLMILLISYIQPFTDGNKRTARIASNAMLLHHRHCPLSFRTVDSVHYKKAMLLFYEQNNISAFKDLFIDQFSFAVNTYF